MTWNSFGEFIAMGGYGTFVWGSYAVTAIVIAIELVSVRKRLTAAIRAIRHRKAP